MYPKHVELRIHQQNYLVASSWHSTLFHEEDARSNNPQETKFVVHRVSSDGHFTINEQSTGTVLNKGYFVPWHHFRFNLLDTQLECFYANQRSS